MFNLTKMGLLTTYGIRCNQNFRRNWLLVLLLLILIIVAMINCIWWYLLIKLINLNGEIVHLTFNILGVTKMMEPAENSLSCKMIQMDQTFSKNAKSNYSHFSASKAVQNAITERTKAHKMKKLLIRNVLSIHAQMGNPVEAICAMLYTKWHLVIAFVLLSQAT